ncbi:hypothetical protein [Loigolactobacillus backii]|nr:hypothetical protein [Loigolactobacillus backii]MDA5389059.1 hypothetical protein [Loigolactobacillus backii]
MPQTHVDAVLGLDAYLTNADVIKNIQQDVDHIAKAGDAAVINIVTQAQYDALTDKTGVYFIEG